MEQPPKTYCYVIGLLNPRLRFPFYLWNPESCFRKHSSGGALSALTSPWTFVNTIFVSATTTVWLTVFFFVLFMWVANRQFHFRERKEEDKSTTDDKKKRVNSKGERNQERTEILGDKSLLTGKRTSWASLLRYELEKDEEGEDEEVAPSLPTFPSSKKQSVRDLSAVVSKIEVFSYLSSEAFMECMGFMEYVDVPFEGTLFERETLDGSLYAVVSGEISVSFYMKDSSSSDAKQSSKEAILSFKAGPGDLVTSLITIIAGLVQQARLREAWVKSHTNLKLVPDGVEVKAVASANGTRLIRVPPQCFLAMLDKFPLDVHRIAQTILNRLQRVTLRTIVESLGLQGELFGKEELERPQEREARINSKEWKRMSTALEQNDLDMLAVKEDAVTVAAVQLGLPWQSGDLLSDTSSIISLPPGQWLIRAGRPSNSMYILLRGDLDIGTTKKESRRIMFAQKAKNSVPPNTSTRTSSVPVFNRLYKAQPGQFVGRLACMTGDINIASVRNSSQEDVILLKIPRVTFEKIIHAHPCTLTHCLDSLLYGLVSPVVYLLDWMIDWIHVQASEDIIHQGDACDSIFMVLNGRLRASGHQASDHSLPGNLSSTTHQRKHEEYGRGAIIGEVEALTGSNWPHDVYAVRQSELARVPMSLLRAIMRLYPQSGLNFATVIASQVQRKYRNNMNQAPYLPRGQDGGGLTSILPSYGLSLATVAVVPLSDGVDLLGFCSTLNVALEAIAPTKLMTKAFVRQHLGDKVFRQRNAMHDLKMTRLLGDMEESHRLVLYQADFRYTWWTRKCIQQADCVLLIVDSETAPEKRRVETCLAWAYDSLNVRVELVVVKSPSAVGNAKSDYYDVGVDSVMNPSDRLSTWSERRHWITGHHLVRAPFDAHVLDFHRMCRRVTGRSIGLVLGGGGARGLAHIGVICALKEAGVTIDMVGGTSQGAFIGALYAKSPDRNDLFIKNARLMADGMSDIKEKLFDMTLPLTSFFNGSRFNRQILACLGDIRIQDLVLNFFCVTTDIRKSLQVVHTKGLCWKYVRASMSLQGYLPPVSEDGSLLLDGGYMNVLPADVMLQQGAAIVIAVDVSREVERDYYEYGTHLSGWWLLWNSWNPFVKTVKVPSMADLSEMLSWVSADQHKKNIVDGIDLYLRPKVDQYGILDFDKFDEIVKIGYEYAKPIIDEWVEQNPWLKSGHGGGARLS